MFYIFTRQGMSLFRLKKDERGRLGTVTIHFPGTPSDELLNKLLVYAANLAMEEGMNICEELSEATKITE